MFTTKFAAVRPLFDQPNKPPIYAVSVVVPPAISKEMVFEVLDVELEELFKVSSLLSACPTSPPA